VGCGLNRDISIEPSNEDGSRTVMYQTSFGVILGR